MSSPVSLIIVTSSVSQPMRARRVVTYIPTTTVVSSFLSADDSKVDYTSLLGMEDRRKRFSEEIDDKNLKETIRIKKMYRDLQRQVHCKESSKESSHTNSIVVRNMYVFFVYERIILFLQNINRTC